jgi:hypothetical protein
MKIRVTFLSMLAAMVTTVATAQVVEFDDMYFNAKDRTKLQASKPLTLKTISAENEVATAINPTDSYSARNINPEFISQDKLNTASSDEYTPYFIPDYSPLGVNQNIYNNQYSSLWNNYNPTGWNYGNSFYNPYGNYNSGMYGWDPYGYNNLYGYNNSMYGYNNMYNSGWSSGWSLGFGNCFSCNSWSWGNSPFWNNYYGWNSYSSYYGGGWNNYPRNIIIINNGDNAGRNVVYGKRVSRSSDYNNVVTTGRSVASGNTDSQGRVRGTNGRTSNNNTAGTYYQRGWRSNPDNTSTSKGWSSGRSGNESSNNSGYTNRSNNTNNNSGFTNSGSRSNNSSSFENSSRSSNWGGGNSNSNFSTGGGSRSSSGGGSSSSSSGSRRGRD